MLRDGKMKLDHFMTNMISENTTLIYIYIYKL